MPLIAKKNSEVIYITHGIDFCTNIVYIKWFPSLKHYSIHDIDGKTLINANGSKFFDDSYVKVHLDRYTWIIVTNIDVFLKNYREMQNRNLRKFMSNKDLLFDNIDWSKYAANC